MAKTTKKVSKKTTSPKTEVVLKPAPPVEPGYVSVVMNRQDVATLTNLLTICADIFNKQALLAAQQNLEDVQSMNEARYSLCFAFANRFATFHNMGEPESRDLH